MLLNIWGMFSVMDISVRVLVIMLFVLKVWNKEKLIGTKFFGVNCVWGEFICYYLFNLILDIFSM